MSQESRCVKRMSSNKYESLFIEAKIATLEFNNPLNQILAGK